MRLVRELLLSIKTIESKWFSTLATVINTHKEQGEIKYRSIHASVNYAFAGLSAWATRHMQLYTAKMKHLVNSTENIVKRLRALSWQIDKEPILYKFDIKEFYMNGTADQLIQGLCEAMRMFGPMINIAEDNRVDFDNLTIRVVRFLLENQYIITEYGPGKVGKIKKVLEWD